MKIHLALLLMPVLVQCSSSSSSHGSSGDSGAEDAGDAAADVTSSSSSGGVVEAGSSSGAGDSSGGSGSGSGGSGSGGSSSGGSTCSMQTTTQYVKYMVTNAMSSNVITMSFAVDASLTQQTAMPEDYWVVAASGSSCFYPESAQLRLGGDIDTDAGIVLPTASMTWTLGGKEYPQTATEAAIAFSEVTDPSMGTGNYWLSSSGTLSGMPIGTGCYELDFTNVVFSKDAAFLPSRNQATGNFIATGTARVGSNCP